VETKTISTRAQIISETLAVLEASSRPLHFKEIAKVISWKPEPGARTLPENSVYFYCYEDDQDGGKIKFLRRGIFGLRSRKYTNEQIQAAIPTRASKPGQGKDVVIVPATLTDEQRKMLESMGILAK
jgi:hypothetical protein